MKFSEIIKRVTGFSTPVFGVSWNPPESERSVAKQVIAELEDRRVLFNPCGMEVPHHCVESIIGIRQIISKDLGKLDDKSNLAISLRAIRASCRKFLDTVQADGDRIVRFGADGGHFASWVFNGAIGELRGVVGIHLAQIATQYGLDVEDQLATIFPAIEDQEGQD